MPTLSASDYTQYLKFKAAAASPIQAPIQTRVNVSTSQSAINAQILASQAAKAATPTLTPLYASGSVPFVYTGVDQTFVVPPTVYALTVALSGAGGETATDGSNQGEGGAGGYVSGTLPVSPGDVLTVVVGGKTGYGGGGGAGAAGGGRGGGRTAILRNGTDIVTAGGGGGGGAKTQGGAGGGVVGASGAAIGGLSGAEQIVVDSTGNLFIANTSRHTILKVTPAGVVSVFAGSDGTSGSADGTTLARFNTPKGLAIDSGNNLYVGDTGNFKIRKVVTTGASSGTVSTLAGTGSTGSADNATGTSASFAAPDGLAIVGTTLYIADRTNNKIRAMSLTANYAVTSPYGSGTAGGGDANGTSATFNAPYGITTDGTNLYVSDSVGHRIRKITISTTAVLTLAGTGSSGSANNATGTSATFNTPRGLAVVSSTLYVADTGNHLIRAVSLTSPYAVTTYSGTAGTAGFTGTMASTALYSSPFTLTTASGTLFVSDQGNNLIREIVLATGVVSDGITDATGGTQAAVGTGGTGAGNASGTTGGAGKSGAQAGGGGGGYYGGGGGTTSAAGAGGSSFTGQLQGASVSLQGGGSATNTDGSARVSFTYGYKDAPARPVVQTRSNPEARSTVSYAGTSGALSSSATQRPGGLPTGFKNSQGTYTRLPQSAGW